MAFLPFKWFNPFSEITKAIILIAVRVYMQGEAFPSAPGRLVRCLRDIQCPVTEGHFCGMGVGPHAPHLQLFIVMERGVGYTQYGEQGSGPAQNVPQQMICPFEQRAVSAFLLPPGAAACRVGRGQGWNEHDPSLPLLFQRDPLKLSLLSLCLESERCVAPCTGS